MNFAYLLSLLIFVGCAHDAIDTPKPGETYSEFKKREDHEKEYQEQYYSKNLGHKGTVMSDENGLIRIPVSVTALRNSNLVLSYENSSISISRDHGPFESVFVSETHCQ
jgi:hypothetical protein